MTTYRVRLTEVYEFDVELDPEDYDGDDGARATLVSDSERYDMYPRREEWECVDSEAEIRLPRKRKTDAEKAVAAHPKSCPACNRYNFFMACAELRRLNDDLSNAEDE